MASYCKSCNAEIEWVKSEASGRPMPLDVTRDGRGNIVETPNGNLAVAAGMAHPYGSDDKRLARDRRASHFVTCPQAGDWRRS